MQHNIISFGQVSLYGMSLMLSDIIYCATLVDTLLTVIMLSVIMLNVVMLNDINALSQFLNFTLSFIMLIVYTVCHYDKCYHTKCHYAEYYYTECHIC